MIYDLARRLLWIVFRVLWRPRVHGRSRLGTAGPVILASNHLSFSDSVVLPLVVPRKLTFLAKSEYFTGRGVRGRAMALFFRVVGAVPVCRSGRRDDSLAALRTALDVLTTGGAFALYPEGTRSRDGRLYRGRTGVAWLALASGAPVVPVALAGTELLQPIGTRLPRLHRVQVRFGSPVDPAPYQARQAAGESAGRIRREFTDVVMGQIAAMSGQERATGYNDLPLEDVATAV